MEKIQQYIEHTNLSPTLTIKDAEQLVQEAIHHEFHGICIPPFWVKKVARDKSNSNIKVITVIGFPLGYQMTNSKLAEIDSAINDGVDEVDMVLNISAFKSNMPWAKIDVAKCANLAHQHDILLKVIIETAYLTHHEIIAAAKLCHEAGADYVKTSTGLAPEGAKVEDVQLIRNNIPSNVGIKASGGIRDLASIIKFIEAGADRIGTSRGVQIMTEFLKTRDHGSL